MTPIRTAILHMAALLACSAAWAQAPANAAAATGPVLRPDATGRFIPFVTPLGEASRPPKLQFEVRTPPGSPQSAARGFAVTMDTGSTGVVISAADLPGYSDDEAGPAGWEFLSSSKRLWVGRWVVRDLVFRAAEGDVVARVPVLAVQKEMICPCWDEKANQPVCEQPTKTTVRPKGIVYMGVGFGREHDGQPQGTPDKNPLLNLVAIDGRPVREGEVHAGYIVTKSGVHAGLTPANAAGFGATRLQPGSLLANGQPASSDPRDWQQASMAVSVAGRAPEAGSVLVDTGIAQMYLTVADPASLPTQQIPNPSRPGHTSNGLKEGTPVQVLFPDAQAPVARYVFNAGGAGAPRAVLVNRPPSGSASSTCAAGSTVAQGASAPFGRPAFVNTGMNLLQQYDVLFDAEGGWFGLRPLPR
ncbi:hypothetical protein [Paracidovorax avenae]|uniref:hypothetical protein n=1 Tax=Paracidovorax avenae TaxID=80867 RepID=UPI000D2084FE|nr:hypothetical protein [Paracidovorax avenae]AVT14374.1 hypothetical protein C8235_16740 [Paracidovorax avenae]